MNRIPSATVVWLAILASVPVAAQSSPKPWTGALRDDHRRPIAGASVHVESGGHSQTAVTSGDGSFSFPALPPAVYTLTVQYRGATAALPNPIQLPRDAHAVLELSAGGALSITDQANTGEGTGGETLSGKAVSDLPLNKRDFSALLLLAAGTMTDTNGASNFTQQFAINGQRGTAAVFAMDGADSSDPEMGGATFTNFNVDAVEEIPYGPEIEIGGCEISGRAVGRSERVALRIKDGHFMRGLAKAPHESS